MNDITYKCSRCGLFLERLKFFWTKKEHRNNSICKDCRKENLKLYRAANKEKIAAQRKINYAKNRIDRLEYARMLHIKRTYGLTLDQYDTMLKEQKFVCRICKSKTKRRLDIDHCHKTDAIRGLLCSNCNQGLGKFKDSPLLLNEAALYLIEALKKEVAK